MLVDLITTDYRMPRSRQAERNLCKSLVLLVVLYENFYVWDVKKPKLGSN